MRRPPLALFAATAAFLLPIVYLPPVHALFWSPGAALLLLVVAVGVPRLVAQAAGRDRAALAAVGFVLVAALSAALSDDPTVGFLGLYNWGTGALYLAGIAGAWAIGRALDGGGRDLLERALLAGAGVNLVVALLQTLVDLEALHLGLHSNRAPGLLSNPVYFGTLVAGALGVAAWHAARREAHAGWIGAVVAGGVGLQLAGGRASLGAGVAVVLVAAAVARAWRGVVVVGALVVGVVIGSGIVAVGGGSDATGRLAATVSQAGGGGVGVRLDTWRAGLEAVADRPALGVGPGQYRTATSPERTLRLARQEAPDVSYVDAHNVVVEYPVTTGLLGAAALLSWLVLAGRRARGPLALFAVGMALCHLLEPQSVRTTPLALLALGAAAPVAGVVGARRALGAATALLSAIAVAVGTALLVGDWYLEEARLDLATAPAVDAERLLPPWPEPASMLARVATFRSVADRDEGQRAVAVRWRREAVDRDPTDPRLWNDLAEAEADSGRLDDAARHFREALRWNPVSTRARNGLGRIALRRGDEAEAERWLRASLAIRADQPAVRRLLRGL